MWFMENIRCAIDEYYQAGSMAVSKLSVLLETCDDVPLNDFRNVMDEDRVGWIYPFSIWITRNANYRRCLTWAVCTCLFFNDMTASVNTTQKYNILCAQRAVGKNNNCSTQRIRKDSVILSVSNAGSKGESTRLWFDEVPFFPCFCAWIRAGDLGFAVFVWE